MSIGFHWQNEIRTMAKEFFGKVKGAKVPALKVKSVEKAPVMGKMAMAPLNGGKFEHARPEGTPHGIGGVALPTLPAEHSSKHN